MTKRKDPEDLLPAGRPTSYNEKKQKIADDYLANHATKYGDPVPNVFGLGDALKVCKATVYNWDHPAFLDTLAQINQKQGKLLIAGGITGELNTVITKLMLHNHGLNDKVDQTLSGPDGQPIKHEVSEIKVNFVKGVDPTQA